MRSPRTDIYSGVLLMLTFVSLKFAPMSGTGSPWPAIRELPHMSNAGKRARAY